MDTLDLISIPIHPFEPQLTLDARVMRKKVIKANIDRYNQQNHHQHLLNDIQLDLDLKCSYTKKRMIYPVRLKDCEHDKLYDLTSLIYNVMITQKPKQCLICQSTFTEWEQDVILDFSIKKIIDETRPDCGSVCYYPQINFYMIIQTQKPTEKLKNDMKTIIQQNFKKVGSSLETIIQARNSNVTSREEYKIDTYYIYLICPFSGRRINYPVRFKNCDHLECLDLEELIKISQDNLEWKCPYCGVSSMHPTNDIEIDKTLLKVCLKESKKCTEVAYIPSKKKIMINSLINDPYFTGINNDGDLTIQEKLILIQEAMDTIFLLTGSDTKNEIDKNLIQTHKRINPNSNMIELAIKMNMIFPNLDKNDQTAELLIEYPARTKKCEHIIAYDLRTYLFDWACGKNFCRICKCEFEHPIEDIYLDFFYFRALIYGTPKVLYNIKKNIFLPLLGDSNELLRPLVLPANIIIGLVDNEIGYNDKRYKNKEVLNISLTCKLLLNPKKMMEKPIATKNCNHSACFDLVNFANLSAKKRPLVCTSPGCGQPLLITNMVIDTVIMDVIQKVNKEFGKNPNFTFSVRYNVREKQIIYNDDDPVESEIVVVKKDKNAFVDDFTSNKMGLYTVNPHLTKIHKDNEFLQAKTMGIINSKNEIMIEENKEPKKEKESKNQNIRKATSAKINEVTQNNPPKKRNITILETTKN